MKAIPVILCIGLLLLAACAQQQTAAPAPVAPAQPAQPPAQPQPPVQEAAPNVSAAPPSAPPAPSNVMDATTAAALDKNFAPGVKLALSSSFYRMKIGDSKVIGIAIRGMNPESDDYQITFDLNRAYDKDNSAITSGIKQVFPWVSSNLNDTAKNGLSVVTLNNREEKRYNFLIQVKPTFADGTPTLPGTYEFNVKAFYGQVGTPFINRDYDSQLLSILVES